MLYREIIAFCSQIHTKHINTMCEQNVELLNVKTGGTYSNHWALKQVSRIKVRSSASTHSKPLHADQRVDSPISMPSHSQTHVNILRAARSPYVRECGTWPHLATQYSLFTDRPDVL